MFKFRDFFIICIAFVSLVANSAFAKSKAKKNQPTQQRKTSIFVSVVESFQYREKRQFQTSADNFYEASEFTGLIPFFSLGVDIPYGDSWAFRFGFLMRKTNLEGEATLTDNSSIYRFLLEQNFIGGEAGLRYAPQKWGLWSLMGGVEFSKARSADLKVLKGSPISSGDLDLPLFAILSGALLYQRPLTKNLIIEPGLRFGTVVTMDPFILLLEAMVSLHF